MILYENTGYAKLSHRSIESPTHKLKTKQTATKAVVETSKNQTLGDGFLLFVSLAEIHVPRMWVETLPDDNNSQVEAIEFIRLP